MNAIEVADVTKVYRRYARKRQFATLKSALLSGSLISDLEPNETFTHCRTCRFGADRTTYGSGAMVGRARFSSSERNHEATTGRCVTAELRADRLGAGSTVNSAAISVIHGHLGLTNREITSARRDRRVRRAERLHRLAVKTYSSGCTALGFAVASTSSRRLLIDEVLASRQASSHKCSYKFAEFRRRAKTLLSSRTR